MANEFDRGVPRGDHDARAEGAAAENEERARAEGGAADRVPRDAADGVGQGSHTQGAGEPDPDREPGGSRGSDRGGADHWGAERAGGSTIDKRAP